MSEPRAVVISDAWVLVSREWFEDLIVDEPEGHAFKPGPRDPEKCGHSGGYECRCGASADQHVRIPDVRKDKS